MPRFPDVERLLVTYLTTTVVPTNPATPTVEHAGGKTPDDLAAVLPYVRVRRTGGPSDGTNDYPTVQVDVFATTRDAARDLSETIREHLCGPTGPRVALFDRASCSPGPRELSWSDDPNIRRFNATYEVVTRRRGA